MTDPASIELHVLAFLIERRLTEQEAVAVVKMVKADPSVGRFMTGRWHEPATAIAPPSLAYVKETARRKVLAWMDRYNEGHSARCLFTGES